MTGINFDNIPPEMKALKNWVLWKYEEVKGRKTKIPYQVNGRKADTTKPETWTGHEEAVKALYDKKGFDGLGFVFSEESGIMGLDFDHVKDPETGEWDKEALEEILSLNSYAEISPSGEGAHVICIAEIPGERRRKGPREMYETARYFTVTGDHIEGSPLKINVAQRGVNALYKKWFESEKKQTTQGATIPVKSKALSNSEILEIAGRAANGEEFKSLYAGNGDTGDHSADDLKLCSMLAFYTQDPGQIDSLFCGSGLYRAKWDRRDYKERTINTALQGLTATYNPEKKKPGRKEGPESRTRIINGVELPAMEPPLLDLDNPHNRGVAYTVLSNEFLKSFKKVITLADTEEIRVYEGGIYPQGKKDLMIANYIREELALKKYKTHLSPSHVQNVISTIKAKTCTDREKLNRDLNKIVLKNGILNIMTKELKPHTAKEFYTTKINIEYDPEVQPPEVFKHYLNTTFKGVEWEIPIIQELFGYCLYRSYDYEYFFMLIGGGENGKTTLLNILTEFIGSENTASLSLHDITNPKDVYTLSSLYGKMANFCGEIGKGIIRDTRNLKTLTGRDDIETRYLRKDFFKFRNYAKLVFAMNEAPEIDDFTEGFKRRVVILDFPNSFKKGDGNTIIDLDKRCTEPEALTGILNWALEGLHRLIENGKISDQRTNAEKGLLYDKRSRPMYYFVRDCIEEANGDMVIKEELEQAYTLYAQKRFMPTLSKTKIKNKLISECKEIDITVKEMQVKAEQLREVPEGIKIPKRPYVYTGIKINYEAIQENTIQERIRTNTEEEKETINPDMSEYKLLRKDLINYAKAHYKGIVDDLDEFIYDFCRTYPGYPKDHKKRDIKNLAGMLKHRGWK